MLKKNDKLFLKIDDLNHLGFGVGHHEGLAIFVADTVMGDECEVQMIKVNKTYGVARLLSLTKKSERRIPPRCSLPCRACAYRLISYEDECALKKKSVEMAFRKAGLTNVEIASLIPSPQVSHYRNKAQYPVASTKSGIQIGFYAPKSHRVLDAMTCELAPKMFSDVLKLIRSFLEEYHISIYDEESGNGLLRHIYLRRGEVSGELLICLVLTENHLPKKEELISRLCAAFPETVGILTNINPDQTNVILGDTFHTLWGRDYLLDTLAGVELEITAPSFYQVNHSATELLYAKAREVANLRGDELLLDLYCGAGSIGLSMADGVREVIGIEIVPSAVECAKRNATRAGVKNASFYTADASLAEKILQDAELARGEAIRPDIVILDPPRKGSTEKLLSFIATSLCPSRIVYISCNPDTLARDCAFLRPLGYDIGIVTPVDLFPMAGHVESVVCLTRSAKAT